MKRVIAIAKAIWTFLDHYGRAATLWVSFGASAVVTGLAAWAIDAFVAMPLLVFVVVTGGLFILLTAVLALTLPHVVNRIPPPPPRATPVVASDPSLTAPERPDLPMSELEATVIRNRERVVRSNVQNVLNELADNKKIINDAIRDYGDFWDTLFSFDVWNNVRDGLMPERGFHTAFNATRDAYHALFDAEALARNANERRESILNWEQTRVTQTLDSIEEAERELVAFLSKY